jgi:CrcB protein
MTMFYVALGGASGAVLRYFCTISLAFPYATLFVNVAGSLLMGLLFIALTSKGQEQLQYLLLTGALGGFTTFSAFSLDALKLFTEGQILGALVYVGGTVLLCLAAVGMGASLGRALI